MQTSSHSSKLSICAESLRCLSWTPLPASGKFGVYCLRLKLRVRGSHLSTNPEQHQSINMVIKVYMASSSGSTSVRTAPFSFKLCCCAFEDRAVFGAAELLLNSQSYSKYYSHDTCIGLTHHCWAMTSFCIFQTLDKDRPVSRFTKTFYGGSES